MAERVTLYARISLDRSGDSEAPDRQLADLRKYADARGWTVAGEHVDRNLTGWKKVDRPGYEAALAQLRSGEASVLAAWKLDRVVRNVAATAALLDEMRDLNASLVCLRDGIDTSTPMGRAMAQMAAIMAELEIENTRTRIQAKNRADAAAGKYVKSGGRRAFGRERTGDLVEAEAEALREAAGIVLEGGTLYAAAKRLNDRELLTPAGNPWTSSQMGRTLREPHLAGLRYHLGQLTPGAFEAVWDEEFRLRLLARLEQNKAFPVSGGGHLLSGLVWCAECGKRMAVNNTTAEGGKWQCRKSDGGGRCGRVSVAEHRLDSEVVERWRARAAALAEGAQWETEVPATDVEAVRRALEADQEAQAQLVTARYVDRTVDDAGYQRAYLALAERIVALEAELASARTEPTTTFLMRPLWLSTVAAGEIEPSNDGMRTLIERVLVRSVGKRGRVWRPERVEVEWLA